MGLVTLVTGARISGNKSGEFEKGNCETDHRMPSQCLLAARLAPIVFVSGNKRLAIACRPRNTQESIRCLRSKHTRGAREKNPPHVPSRVSPTLSFLIERISRVTRFFTPFSTGSLSRSPSPFFPGGRFAIFRPPRIRLYRGAD